MSGRSLQYQLTKLHFSSFKLVFWQCFCESWVVIFFTTLVTNNRKHCLNISCWVFVKKYNWLKNSWNFIQIKICNSLADPMNCLESVILKIRHKDMIMEMLAMEKTYLKFLLINTASHYRLKKRSFVCNI